MAASGHTLASLLECPICLDAFQDPRMLISCFHTLCHKCIEDYIKHSAKNGQFQCPVCRATLQIPENGADSYPKNFFVNSCIDAVKGAGTGGARSKTGEKLESGQNRGRDNVCSNSDDGDECTQPEHFCLECCEYYCKTCSRVHRKSKATRSHAQVPLEDLTEEMLVDARAKSETPRCQKHADKMLELYCSTCQCAVCPICCHTGHQSHKFCEITDVDEDLKTELGEVISGLQDTIDGVKEQTDQVKQLEQQLNSNTSIARETVMTLFQKMHQLLYQKEKEIDQKICKVNEEGAVKTGVQNKNLILHGELLESLQSFAHDLLNRGSVFNRLASLPDVRSHLTRFKSSHSSQGDATDTVAVPSSADLIADNVASLMLEEEVMLDHKVAETVGGLKIRQKCCITPDQVMSPTINIEISVHVKVSRCPKTPPSYPSSTQSVNAVRFTTCKQKHYFKKKLLLTSVPSSSLSLLTVKQVIYYSPFYVVLVSRPRKQYLCLMIIIRIHHYKPAWSICLSIKP